MKNRPIDLFRKRIFYGKGFLKEMCPHCVHLTEIYEIANTTYKTINYGKYDCGLDAHLGSVSRLIAEKPCLRTDWLVCPFNADFYEQDRS